MKLSGFCEIPGGPVKAAQTPGIITGDHEVMVDNTAAAELASLQLNSLPVRHQNFSILFLRILASFGNSECELQHSRAAISGSLHPNGRVYNFLLPLSCIPWSPS